MTWTINVVQKREPATKLKHGTVVREFASEVEARKVADHMNGVASRKGAPWRYRAVIDGAVSGEVVSPEKAK